MPTPPASLYREILLTQGQVALVSSHRFAALSQHPWYAKWSAGMKSFYAARNVAKEGGGQRTLRMHRAILGLSHSDDVHVDHINGNTLDNRDENLRACTRSENMHNRGMNRGNPSGFKGVSKQGDGWQARIRINGKEKYLGYASTPEGASKLYQIAARELHGKFARSIETGTSPETTRSSSN